MRRTETIRIVTIVVILIAAFYFLIPTFRLMTMSEDEKTILKNTDPQSYDNMVRKSIKLGLDLQGGLRLVLEPEVADITSSAASNVADQALVIIQNRINGMGLTEPEIRKRKNNQIVVEIPGIDSVSVADAKKQISQIAKLEFRFLETPTVTQQTIEKIDALLASKFGDEVLETSADSGDAPPETIDSAAQTESEIDSSAEEIKDETLADIDEADTIVTDVEKALAFETSLSAYLMNADRSSFYVKGRDGLAKIRMIMSLPEVQAIVPAKSEFLFSTGQEESNGIFYDRFYLVKKEVVLTGESIDDIQPSFSQLRQPEVLFEITSNWRHKWASVTGNNLQKPLAIVLDGRVESAPNISTQISTSGKITMRSGATFVEAQQLSNVLKSGALPTRLIIREDVIIGPSLGKDSIAKGVNASLIGLILVIVFMVFYYRVSGLIATTALVFNLFVLMAVLTILNATLTVPGVAGIVLLVGISVDAAVLIFERIREEIRTGKTVRAAIDAGYGRATVAIVDSNITTLIVAGLLYYIGSGPVKGFAVTLSIGILISLFSALVVTRTIFEFRKTYRKLSI
jgi:SecD/SecF fusion protein